MSQVNEERLRLFTAALRSGEFEQGIGYLCVLDKWGKPKFCCLGVATEVAIANGLDVEMTKDDNIAGGYRSYRWTEPARREVDEGILIEYGLLPEPVRLYYGLPSRNPELRHQGRPFEASNLNDEERLPFAEIADLFEATYLSGRPVPSGGEDPE
jgi:hypothetical protein